MPAWLKRVIVLRSSRVFTLGPDEWLLFKKLPDYAARTRRKKLEVIQLPLPEIDENQQQAVSSQERQLSG